MQRDIITKQDLLIPSPKEFGIKWPAMTILFFMFALSGEFCILHLTKILTDKNRYKIKNRRINQIWGSQGEMDQNAFVTHHAYVYIYI